MLAPFRHAVDDGALGPHLLSHTGADQQVRVEASGGHLWALRLGHWHNHWSLFASQTAQGGVPRGVATASGMPTTWLPKLRRPARWRGPWWSECLPCQCQAGGRGTDGPRPKAAQLTTDSNRADDGIWAPKEGCDKTRNHSKQPLHPPWWITVRAGFLWAIFRVLVQGNGTWDKPANPNLYTV